MTDQEWAALVAQVRPPDQREEFRALAAQFVEDACAVDALAEAVDVSKFVDADGTLDAEKVVGHLTALFGAAAPDQKQPPQPPAPASASGRGSAGKAAAAKRFGTTTGTPAGQTPPPGQRPFGQAGRDAAAKRYGAAK